MIAGIIVVVIVLAVLLLLFRNDDESTNESRSDTDKPMPIDCGQEESTIIPINTPQESFELEKIDPFRIPANIINLLWFLDGEFANYKNVEYAQDEIDLGYGIKVRLSVHIPGEPSLISKAWPIRKPLDYNAVPKLNYYPRYECITPEQRYIYLQWLKNVDNQIDIGYVFIFYYGLERFLLTSKAKEAADMILRLRSNHKNKSFLLYSQGALLAKVIRDNDINLLIKFSDSMRYEDLKISSLYIYTKWKFNQPLFPEEIIRMGKDVSYTNTNYIKNEKELFIHTMKNMLFQKYKNPVLPINDISIDDCKKISIMMFANVSLVPEQIEIPDFYSNINFSARIFKTLKDTHEEVKRILKQRRANSSGSGACH